MGHSASMSDQQTHCSHIHSATTAKLYQYVNC